MDKAIFFSSSNACRITEFFVKMGTNYNSIKTEDLSIYMIRNTAYSLQLSVQANYKIEQKLYYSIKRQNVVLKLFN